MAGLNWPGLLAWSTKYHDGTAPSQFKVMSDEDRKFLEQAMEEAFGKIEDPNKVLMECITKIQAEDRTEESILTTLEIIDRLCDDPDVARNAEKLDGLQPLLNITHDFGGAVRTRTLEILALLFSNNPHIQEAGLKRGAMPLFLAQVKAAERGSDERSKSFRALVALVRHLPAHESTLLRSEGGVALLIELLDDAEEARTREKAAAFILSMASNGEALKTEEAAAFAAALAPLLLEMGGQGVQYRETLSACALELARFAGAACPPGLAEAAATRLAALRAAAAGSSPAEEGQEGEEGSEEAALQACVEALGSG